MFEMFSLLLCQGILQSTSFSQSFFPLSPCSKWKCNIFPIIINILLENSKLGFQGITDNHNSQQESTLCVCNYICVCAGVSVCVFGCVFGCVCVACQHPQQAREFSLFITWNTKENVANSHSNTHTHRHTCIHSHTQNKRETLAKCSRKYEIDVVVRLSLLHVLFLL